MCDLLICTVTVTVTDAAGCSHLMGMYETQEGGLYLRDLGTTI